MSHKTSNPELAVYQEKTIFNLMNLMLSSNIWRYFNIQTWRTGKGWHRSKLSQALQRPQRSQWWDYFVGGSHSTAEFPFHGLKFSRKCQNSSLNFHQRTIRTRSGFFSTQKPDDSDRRHSRLVPWLWWWHDVRRHGTIFRADVKLMIIHAIWKS